MQSISTQRFALLAAQSDAEIDVAEGALIIAAETDPSLDVPHYLERLEDLAAHLRGSVEAAGEEPFDRVGALNRGVFEDLGFKGNQGDYEDLRNSLLHEVLERRTGIPITLSVVYVEIARRLGLEASGVGFPGHFLAKIEGVPSPEGNDEVVVDPFFGRILGLDECQERLRQIAGKATNLGPDVLRTATPREILARILSNLKNIHLKRGEPLEALSCIDRILMLEPQAALEYRDRGLINEQLGFTEPAITDLERFLALVPGHESDEVVRISLDRLSRHRSILVH